MNAIYLNAVQFKTECEKCLQCATKPCEKACPASVSPHDFIAAAKKGDFKTAAELILKQNPFAETCGLICPDKFCRKACLRAHLDCAIKIPAVQAYIMKKYRELNLQNVQKNTSNKQKIAIIGSGPAGIGAASVFLKAGFAVEVFEKSSELGGALKMIPDSRLPKDIVAHEWIELASNNALTFHFNQKITEPKILLEKDFSGVVIATGENKFRRLGIEGENLSINYDEYLLNPQKYAETENVAIVGGGAVAVDCAVSAKTRGAKNVEMLVRRRLSDMRITENERKSLLEKQIDITTMTRVTKIIKNEGKLTAYTCKTQFDSKGKLVDIAHTEIARVGFDLIILALGSTAEKLPEMAENIVFAGDCVTGSSTAVEAVASGKSAADKLLEHLKAQNRF